MQFRDLASKKTDLKSWKDRNREPLAEKKSILTEIRKFDQNKASVEACEMLWLIEQTFTLGSFSWSCDIKGLNCCDDNWPRWGAGQIRSDLRALQNKGDFMHHSTGLYRNRYAASGRLSFVVSYFPANKDGNHSLNKLFCDGIVLWFSSDISWTGNWNWSWVWLKCRTVQSCQCPILKGLEQIIHKQDKCMYNCIWWQTLGLAFTLWRKVRNVQAGCTITYLL